MCRYLIGFGCPHKQRTTVDPNAESTVVPKTRRLKSGDKQTSTYIATMALAHLGQRPCSHDHC